MPFSSPKNPQKGKAFFKSGPTHTLTQHLMLRLFLVFLIFDISPFSSFSNTVSEYQLFFNFLVVGLTGDPTEIESESFCSRKFYSSFLSQVVSLQRVSPSYIQVCGVQSPLHTFFLRDAPSLIIRIMYIIPFLFLCRMSHIGLQIER